MRRCLKSTHPFLRQLPHPLKGGVASAGNMSAPRTNQGEGTAYDTASASAQLSVKHEEATHYAAGGRTQLPVKYEEATHYAAGGSAQLPVMREHSSDTPNASVAALLQSLL